MAKPPKKSKSEEIETKPDAWDRFEREVDTLVRTPLKPHKAPDASDQTEDSPSARYDRSILRAGRRVQGISV